MPHHEDFHNENNHAKKILDYISSEIERLTPLEKKQHLELTDLIAATGGNYSNDLFIASKMYEMTQRVLLGLNHSIKSPYFTRIDFVPDKKPEKKLYIGKWGVLDPKTRQPIIVDWRSNIANLYYTHQVGPAEYKSPIGNIEGEITLKRMFFFKEGNLKSIIESDIISQSEHLNDVLSDHADSKLRDIVTTIQAEQNAVLRCNPRVPVILQGVAGAGKTTIALHRITWLLYTYRESMAPNNLMVIAPNPLFLDYISAVMPDLGVDSVVQETFYGLAQKLCGKKIPKLDDNASLVKLLTPDVSDEEKRDIRRSSRFKGSLDYKECLIRYMDLLPEKIFPEKDFMLGEYTIAKRSKVLDIYVDELSPFPLKPRINELKKRLKRMADKAVEKLTVYIENETRKRANYMRELIKNNDKLKMEKMKALYTSRDNKLNEIKANHKNVVKDYIKEFKSFKLIDIYKDFLSEEPEFDVSDLTRENTWNAVCRYTNGYLDNKRIESLDIPALIILQKKLFGHKEHLDIHHTVLDEAQDFAPFMFDVLKSLTINEAFTIVGDLAQGIYEYRGINNWNKMIKTVFEGKSQFYELVTSYRNTVEIMQFAENVAKKFADSTRRDAVPVLRHGREPEIIKYDNKIKDLISQVEEMKEKGFKSIALVDKLPVDCKALHRKLSKHIPDLKLLKDTDTEYEAGIMVVPAHLCKGLEFDSVIITNAEESTFPSDRLHSNLLYVVLTRPLHELIVYYEDNLTKLLD